MAMLDRYRKAGGFVQLLTLLETCGPTKQEKFLEIVRAEDPRWADAIRTKMLDMTRIYSWSDETLAEIMGTLQDLTVAIALHGAEEAVRTRIQATFSHGRKRKIDDLFETNKPSVQEISATHVKIIETVRKMAQDGHIRFEKFDPQLAIEENIEEKLAKGTLLQTDLDSASAPGLQIVPSSDGGTTLTEAASSIPESANDPRLINELQALRKRVTDLGKENAILRHELSVAKTKLEQIKKIA